jgi:phosphatidate cytidylyltransferase
VSRRGEDEGFHPHPGDPWHPGWTSEAEQAAVEAGQAAVEVEQAAVEALPDRGGEASSGPGERHRRFGRGRHREAAAPAPRGQGDGFFDEEAESLVEEGISPEGGGTAGWGEKGAVAPDHPAPSETPPPAPSLWAEPWVREEAAGPVESPDALLIEPSGLLPADEDTLAFAADAGRTATSAESSITEPWVEEELEEEHLPPTWAPPSAPVRRDGEAEGPRGALPAREPVAAWERAEAEVPEVAPTTPEWGAPAEETPLSPATPAVEAARPDPATKGAAFLEEAKTEQGLAEAEAEVDEWLAFIEGPAAEPVPAAPPVIAPAEPMEWEIGEGVATPAAQPAPHGRRRFFRRRERRAAGAGEEWPEQAWAGESDEEGAQRPPPWAPPLPDPRVPAESGPILTARIRPEPEPEEEAWGSAGAPDPSVEGPPTGRWEEPAAEAWDSFPEAAEVGRPGPPQEAPPLPGPPEPGVPAEGMRRFVLPFDEGVDAEEAAEWAGDSGALPGSWFAEVDEDEVEVPAVALPEEDEPEALGWETFPEPGAHPSRWAAEEGGAGRRPPEPSGPLPSGWGDPGDGTDLLGARTMEIPSPGVFDLERPSVSRRPISEESLTGAVTMEHRDLAEEVAAADTSETELQALSAPMAGLESGVVGFEDVVHLGSDEQFVEPAPSDLALRVVTGMVLAALLLGSMWVGGEFLAGFIGLLVVLGLGEFYGSLRRQGYLPLALFGFPGGIGLLIGTWFYGLVAIPVAVVSITVLSFFYYAFAPRRRNALTNGALTVLGTLWVTGTAAFAFPIAAAPDFRVLFLAIAATVVATDIGAFFAGRSWGSRPLAPVLSPHKTVEGLAGGVVLGIAAAVAVGYFLEPLGVRAGAALGLVVAVMAPLGDLAESMLKRSLGVKDMGSILPGHGGILDRVDAFLFVLPAVWVLYETLGLLR